MKTSITNLRRALLILLICLVGMAKAMAQSFTVGDLNYTVNSDGTTVTVTGHVNGTSATGSLVIPESVTYEGSSYAVTVIGTSAFNNCSGFTGDLNIPNSVISIGLSAFSCCSGFSGNLNIPSSVNSIGNEAFPFLGFSEVHYNATNCGDASSRPFYGCHGELIIGENVQRIPNHMFYDAGFTGSLIIPNSVLSIGDQAFSGCRGFTGSLTIGNTVTTIGISAFRNCDGFTGSLTIGNSVTLIDYNAFEGCSGFTGDLNIPNSVVEIGGNAFRGCGSFTGILTIGNSVNSLGQDAFRDCNGFTEVHYNATNCGYAASYGQPFIGCGGSLIIGENVERIPDYIFGSSNFTGDLTIPNSVTSIGSCAFSGCSSFTGSLTIPNSVTSIGSAAFSGCSDFSEVYYNATNCADFGSSSYPFAGCGGSLIIGDNVERIPAHMFENGGFTGTLTIPNSVTDIGTDAFSHCSGFTGDLVIPGSITTITNGSFYGCSNFSGNLIILEGVTTIGGYAFYGCSGFNGDLVIPSTMTILGERVFCGCRGFSSVLFNATNCTASDYLGTSPPFINCGGTLTIGDNVESLSRYIFKDAVFTGDLIIPNSVTSIGNGAFQNCSTFTGNLEIPENVVSIGPNAFTNCSGFTTVHYNARNCQDDGHNGYVYFDGCGGTLILGDNVESIPNLLFRDGSFIGSVTIGNSVISIGENPFSGCSLLEQIIVDPLNPVYDSREDCNAIIRTSDNTLITGCQNTNIPNTVTVITNRAFQNLSTLTSIDIPNSVTSIGEQAFLSCTGLTTMTVLAEIPPYLNREVFSNVPKNIPVYIPSGTLEDYQNASGWNEFTCYYELGQTLVFNTYVDEDVYAMNTSIPIHGTVVDGENVPVANVGVEIGVFVMGMKRSLRTTTNEDGQFSATFEPMPSESGYYTVNSGRVGNHSTAVHDDFNIPGMVVMADGYVLCPVTQNQPKTDSIRIRNKCNLELNDIQVSVLSAPEGCSISFMPLSLGALETDYLVYTVNGTELTQGNYYQEIQLQATTSNGAEANFSIWYYCMEPKGILNVAPNSIATTMTKGNSKIVDVMLSNHGTAASGEITIELPEVEWMSVVGSSTLPSLAVNDSAYFSLRLAPSDDIPLTQYSGNIAINCEHGEYVNLPFNITAVSDSTGNLIVDVTDEYTWNTNGGSGPHLANAEVTLTGYFSLETVAHGYTNENGIFNVEQLPEGYYRLHVEADHHEEYDNIILIEAGITNQQDIFLSYQAVTYDWTVVPGEIQDEYEFILNTTYETNVPFPVVTIDAPTSIPDFEESYTFNYLITNHGLINTYNIKLHVPLDEDYLFTPLYEIFDTLSALTTIEIPCTVTRLTNNTHICKHWVESWVEYQYDCGPYFVAKYAHDYTMLGTESCGITPPSGGGIGGGIAGGGGGAPGFGGWWWGGSGHSSLYIHNIPVNTPSGSICVQVGVQFNQQMVMTREAFFGTFNVHNGFDTESLEAIGLNFTVKDEDGNDCTNLFQINTQSLSNITSIDGNGTLGAGLDGTVQILFIPTKEAAPTEPKIYRFGGTFTFFDPYASNTIVCDLYPVPLTVHPSPDLHVDYFMQRDIIGDDALTEGVVEPSVPAELGVIINNKGAGTAKNVILETAEPKIVDNAQGLAINFAMYGASFNGNEAQLGLMEIPFGDIESGRTAVGEWLFTSSLLGHFVSYEANVIHNNSYDNPNLSLVSHLDIHELIHPIHAYGNLEDGINDFLVNDVPDDHNYPDSIYFSNGGRTGVNIVNNISFDHYVTSQDTIVTLTVRPSKTGWNYGVVDDPGSEYVLVGCKRNADNQVILLNNIWQTFVTLRDGEEPIYENKLHFVDTLSNGRQDYTYTLIYSQHETVSPYQINIEDEICEGDDYNLNGFNLTDLSVGTYDETLYIENVYGCDNIISLHLMVYESPEVHIQIDTINQNGVCFRLTAIGADNYEWSTGETTASIIVSPINPTTYSVVGTNSNGCSDSDEVIVSGGTGINENQTTASAIIFPNPAHNKLFIKTSSAVNAVEIFSITGTLVHKQSSNSDTIEIDVQHISSGMYFIRLIADHSVETMRFVKE